MRPLHPGRKCGRCFSVVGLNLMFVSATPADLLNNIAQPASAFQVPWQLGDSGGAAAPAPAGGAGDARRLRPQLAAAFTKSVYDALLQQKVLERSFICVRLVILNWLWGQPGCICFECEACSGKDPALALQILQRHHGRVP